MSVRARIIESVSRAIDLPVDKIESNAGIGSSPGWDSFGHLRVVLELESEFGVRFDMGKIPDLKTIDLIDQELQNLGVS